MPSCLAKRAALGALLAASAVSLNGCWTAPVAALRQTGQARAEPRLIQEGVAVQSVTDELVVRSVDAAARTIVVMDHQAGRPHPRHRSAAADRARFLGLAARG
jgi:hypothetical protein